jgi:hypothetical protein
MDMLQFRLVAVGCIDDAPFAPAAPTQGGDPQCRRFEADIDRDEQGKQRGCLAKAMAANAISASIQRRCQTSQSGGTRNARKWNPSRI